jgi:excinuclease ABC subunit C
MALERRMAERTSQARLLQGVADLFGLDSPPDRIEVYDNSHVQGAHAVGAMIVAGPEGFRKNQYRKFTIKDEGAAGDDFAMMREVFRRRFTRAVEEQANWPDLVLIDGGQGQLNAARETLAELGINEVPLVGVAKGPDRNAGREWFYMPGREPFQLPPDDPVLYYLQRLRDESHRFVIGTHRAARSKAIVQSPLDTVPGIGAARKKALLQHFGSAKAVTLAGLADLENAPGISKALARKVYEFFHGEG